MARLQPLPKLPLPGAALLCLSLLLPGQGTETNLFHQYPDGTVQVENHTFADFQTYVRSDFFKTSGHRCGFSAKRARFRRTEGGAIGTECDCDLQRTKPLPLYEPSAHLLIPVVFHIIHCQDGVGDLSNQRILDQMAVLNEDYGAIPGSAGADGHNTRIQFVLAGITRTANDTWYMDQQEYTYKKALGWDPARYLNVYVNTASGYLGYSYLPQDTPDLTWHGVVVLNETVGGRDNGFYTYDQGRTLVHEIGHHLGLLHTFEGYGCFTGYEAGDLLEDTPSESTEHYGCTPSSSCETPDPIHNYLNYTDDSCMYEFTREQGRRMVCTLLTYRPFSWSRGTAPLTLLQPNGSENLRSGKETLITWSAPGLAGSILLELLKGEQVVGPIAQVPAAQSGFLWNVGSWEGGTAPAGAGYRLRIRPLD